MINNRLQTTALAALLLGVAFTGLAVAQGPVQSACVTVSPSLTDPQCDNLTPVDEELASVAGDLTDCTALDAPDNALCAIGVVEALVTGLGLSADAICTALPATLENDTAPDCVVEFLTGVVGSVDADSTVCGATSSEADDAATCAQDEAAARIDGAVALVIGTLATVTAPAIGTVNVSPGPNVNTGQTVVVSGSFSTFLTRIAPLAAYSTASGNQANDTIASLDDVGIAVTGLAPNTYSASVNNQTHGFTVTFSPSVAGTTVVGVTLTYKAPLGTLATVGGGVLLPLVSDSASATVSAVVPNAAPTANAGSDQTVGKGVLVTLDGAGSSDPDGNPLSFAWTAPAGITLSAANVASPTFTAPATPVDLTFGLTVSDGLLSNGPDSVVIHVVNRAPTANAGNDVTILEQVTTQLTGSGSDPDGDAVTLSWAQTAGPTVTLSDASSAAPSFTAPDVDTPTDLVFTLTASDGSLTGSDSVTIQVSPNGGGTGTGQVEVANTATTLGLVSDDFVGPLAGEASTTDLTVYLHDLNTVLTLDNSKLEAHLTGPQLLDETLAFAEATDSNPDGAGTYDTRRDFRYDLDFPARLQDGAYQFAATYDGSAPVTYVFDVDNVAPTLGAPALDPVAGITQTFRAGIGAIATDPVALSLDDANWGGFAGNQVTELEDLTLAGFTTDDFSFEVSSDGGATWTPVGSLSHDLSTVLNGAGALDLQVRLVSDGELPEGLYTVTAVLTDQSGEASDTVTLYTLTILPENFGFFFGVDDGGDGITLGNGAISPNSYQTSAADPVRVSFTGTYDADLVTVSVGQFQCDDADAGALCHSTPFGPYWGAGDNRNTVVSLYATPDLAGTALSLPVDASGVAAFDLSSLPLGAAGSTLYAVLTVYVPPVINGHYVGTVDVSATGDDV